MNKKGFTLIELLAVIVILAIIALIATPMVLNTIEDARRGAAQSSALTYLSEVEKQIAVELMKDPSYQVTSPIIDEEFATVKGDAPASVSIEVENGVVTGGTLHINGYVVEYDGKTATVTGTVQAG